MTSKEEEKMAMKKDVHITGRDLVNMVQLRPEDLGKYIVIPGPMERLQAILKKIENPIKNFSFMEYSMYTGTHDGIRVTAGNGGRYNADSAIMTEVVCNAGAQNIVRTGSCGALREDINIGDLVIATGVIREDGVTPFYVGDDFSAQADADMTTALMEAAKKVGIKAHVGLIWSIDALLRETREKVEEAAGKGALAVDMVSASLLTIAQLNNVKAGSILAVSDNVITGQMGFVNPAYYMAETRMIDVAFEAIKLLEGKK